MKIFLLALSLVLAGCALPTTQNNLKYNYQERRWESAAPSDELKYNYMEKKYQYAPTDAQLKYNYMEKRWEYAR